MSQRGAETDRLAGRLAAFMARVGMVGDVAGVTRLSGGANLESWLFTCGGAGFVMRRAPTAEWEKERAISLATEAEVIRLARANGVAAPEVVGDLAPADALGIGFVMRAIPGTAEPKVVLREAGPEMIGDLARELAAIHRIDASALDLPAFDAADGVEKLVAQFAGHGGDRPIIALGLAWLRAHVPPPAGSRFNHGDFRIGNLMAHQGRLSGVLDWELVHVGDPHEDLAFGCMPVWRFGHVDKPAFGLADLDSFFAAYEAAGGVPVERERFRFWLVYRTVWWALGCLRMGAYWRDGSDRSLERVVIGRRTAEQELDLLMLLDENAARLPSVTLAADPVRLGEPSAAEMLTAVSEWLADAVKPQLAGRDRFDLAVAQNALGIVRRELADRLDPHDRALADAILAGRESLASPGLSERLRRAALQATEADAPKYPSLRIARALWEQD